jgi:hypothetical protein
MRYFFFFFTGVAFTDKDGGAATGDLNGYYKVSGFCSATTNLFSQALPVLLSQTSTFRFHQLNSHNI